MKNDVEGLISFLFGIVLNIKTLILWWLNDIDIFCEDLFDLTLSIIIQNPILDAIISLFFFSIV